jgi:hypothetical protein
MFFVARRNLPARPRPGALCWLPWPGSGAACWGAPARPCPAPSSPPPGPPSPASSAPCPPTAPSWSGGQGGGLISSTPAQESSGKVRLPTFQFQLEPQAELVSRPLDSRAPCRLMGGGGQPGLHHPARVRHAALGGWTHGRLLFAGAICEIYTGWSVPWDVVVRSMECAL